MNKHSSLRRPSPSKKNEYDVQLIFKEDYIYIYTYIRIYTVYIFIYCTVQYIKLPSFQMLAVMMTSNPILLHDELRGHAYSHNVQL